MLRYTFFSLLVVFYFLPFNVIGKVDSLKSQKGGKNELCLFNYYRNFGDDFYKLRHIPILFIETNGSLNFGDGFGVGYNRRIYRNFWFGASYLKWDYSGIFGGPTKYIVWGGKWYEDGNIYMRFRYEYLDLNIVKKIPYNRWSIDIGGGISKIWGDNVVRDSTLDEFGFHDIIYTHYEPQVQYLGVIGFVKVEHNIWKQYITCGWEFRFRKYVGLESYEYDYMYSLDFHL